MSNPKPDEDLAEIVRGGASRPARKWLVILASLAADRRRRLVFHVPAMAEIWRNPNT
jgi:hypothetical protein